MNRTGKYLEYLRFLQNMLGPFVESYWLAAHSLLDLGDTDTNSRLRSVILVGEDLFAHVINDLCCTFVLEVKQFLKNLHRGALDRIESGKSSYGVYSS